MEKTVVVEKKKTANRTKMRRSIPREPLFIRLCNAFLDNLTLLLKTGLIIGAIVFVKDLRVLLDEVKEPAVAAEVIAPVPREEPAKTPSVLEESALTEGVKQALNCTYREYRESHYDDCVKSGSEIYQKPYPNPDDTSFTVYPATELYAYSGNNVDVLALSYTE